MVCPSCFSDKVVKNGRIRGQQRFLCKNCNKNFTIKENTNSNTNYNNDTNSIMDRFENNNVDVSGIKNGEYNDNITLDSIIQTINESIESQNDNEDIKEAVEVKKVDENKIQLLKKAVEIVYAFLLKASLKFVEKNLNKRLRKDFDLNNFISKAHIYVYEALKEQGIIKEDMEINNTFMAIVIHLDLLLALEDVEEIKEKVNEVKNEAITVPKQVPNTSSNQNFKQIDLSQYTSLDI